MILVNIIFFEDLGKIYNNINSKDFLKVIFK